MGPPSYIQSVDDRNVVTRRMTVNRTHATRPKHWWRDRINVS